MPAYTPAGCVRDESPGQHPTRPQLTRWLLGAGGLGRFGACIEVLPPGTCSSIRPWHRTEGGLVCVLGSEVTLPEGATETPRRDRSQPEDAWTDPAGAPATRPATGPY